MKKGRITIKDLARQLKMSTSTVSRALTDHSDVSSETRRKVKDLAEYLDYQPDPIAVGLRRNKTGIIGIIVPQIVNRFFSKCISGFQEVAHANGYKVMITQSAESQEMEKENVATMINSRVDGLIVALSRQTSNLAHFEKIFTADIPIVFFDRVDESLNTSRVIIDDYEASYNAVKHLIEQGCKKIAHISGPINLEISKKRLAGYKNALKDHQLTSDENHLIFSENQ
ncbi:MAG: LacI family DNA-binding transcriptional regulator, partial [Bacteroidota bacterium]